MQLNLHPHNTIPNSRQAQRDLMTGLPTDLKYFVPCLFYNKSRSKQPTLPQVRHKRKLIHFDPIFEHSSHPLV